MFRGFGQGQVYLIRGRHLPLITTSQNSPRRNKRNDIFYIDTLVRYDFRTQTSG